MSTQFQAALGKLVDDKQYRDQTKIDPRRITRDFQFSDSELSMLAALGELADDDLAAETRATMPGGGCSSGTWPSDRRLKTGIEQVATLPSGIRLYRFRYRGAQTEYVGVLAQEILQVAPHAVSKGSDGFLRVDYQALGLTMLPYAIWQAGVAADDVVGAAA